MEFVSVRRISLRIIVIVYVLKLLDLLIKVNVYVKMDLCKIEYVRNVASPVRPAHNQQQTAQVIKLAL